MPKACDDPVGLQGGDHELARRGQRVERVAGGELFQPTDDLAEERGGRTGDALVLIDCRRRLAHRRPPLLVDPVPAH